MNKFYELLTKSQVDNLYKRRRKIIANYLALKGKHRQYNFKSTERGN